MFFFKFQINALCTDLVFTHFICLAIVNPELYGVCDAPISHVARFNLMQIGQILQMLSLMKYQEPDVKHKDLYSTFDRTAIPDLMDGLLNGSENLDDGPVSISSVQGIRRLNALVTELELQNLVIFFSILTNVFLIK